jgi:hypothetical protein
MQPGISEDPGQLVQTAAFLLLPVSQSPGGVPLCEGFAKGGALRSDTGEFDHRAHAVFEFAVGRRLITAYLQMGAAHSMNAPFPNA